MTRILAARPEILSRTLPFAVFMAFIGLGECLEFLAGRGTISLSSTALYYLYPVKTVVVALVLFAYRREFSELSWRDLGCGRTTFAVLLVGLVSFLIWIRTDWTFPVSGTPPGFDPNLLPGGWLRTALTLFRVAGAVLLVPLMEELFWRSFLLRYLVDHRFDLVAIGSFTWPSFLTTAVLFGLEHHFIIAGIVVGAIYNVVFYTTRSVTQCVLAHAVTNLALAVYVLATGRWYFW